MNNAITSFTSGRRDKDDEAQIVSIFGTKEAPTADASRYRNRAHDSAPS